MSFIVVRSQRGRGLRLGKPDIGRMSMRKTALVLGLLAAAATWPAAQAATVTYKATLGAAAEVPPTKSQGKGSAAVNVDAASKQVSWRVEFAGLTGPAM